MVHRPLDQPELQQRPLALQVSEPGSRHLGGSLGVDNIQALAQGFVIGGFKTKSWDFTDPLHFLRVPFGEALARGGIDQIGKGVPLLKEPVREGPGLGVHLLYAAGQKSGPLDGLPFLIARQLRLSAFPVSVGRLDSWSAS